MTYRLSELAKEDLIRIHQFGVQQFGEAQADRYFNSFFECFDKILKNPLSYVSIDHIKKGYRKCTCGVDSIYYRINDGIVEIMAIIGRQEINQILGGIK